MQIKTLEVKVGDVSSRLTSLQSDLALHQRRLDKLNQLFHLQTVRFHYLKHEYALAVKRLNLRLIDIYKQDEPTTVDVLLAARNFDDVLDQLDYLGAIAAQDKKVAGQVATAKLQIKRQRAATTKVRRSVQMETHVINARVQQQAILRGELLSNRSRLAGAKADKSRSLVITRRQVENDIQESKALEAASAQLAARLRSSEAQASGAATSAGSEPAPEQRLRVARVRADHEPVRHALGDAPSGHRHRGADGHADPRGRKRHRGLVRLDVGLRQPRDDRPPQRPRDPVRPSVAHRRELQRGRRRARRSATSAAPASAPARISTSRSGSTAAPSTLSAISRDEAVNLDCPRFRPPAPPARNTTGRPGGRRPASSGDDLAETGGASRPRVSELQVVNDAGRPAVTA